MRRILLVPAAYLPGLGGVQNVTAHLASELSALGYQVEILTQRYPRKLPTSEVIATIRVLRLLFLLPSLDSLRHGRFDLFVAAPAYFAYTLARLGQYLWRSRPEVVHVHFVSTAALFVLLCRWLIPFQLIVTLHGHDVVGWKQQPLLARRGFRAMLRRATVVTAPSLSLLEAALRIVPEARDKAYVIPNGVDAARFAAAPPFVWQRPYILGVGRLVQVKGFDTLLQAFAELQTDHDLLLAGDGEEEPRLREQIQALGLGARVTLLGRVDADKVASLMSGASLLAIPSRRESFGLVGIEGLSAGVPIVATAVDGLAELLKGTGSLLVPPNDPPALAAAMRLQLQSSPRRRSTSSAGHLSWATVARQYADLYARCLA